MKFLIRYKTPYDEIVESIMESNRTLSADDPLVIAEVLYSLDIPVVLEDRDWENRNMRPQMRYYEKEALDKSGAKILLVEQIPDA